jgi:hypothetical protein
MLFTSHVVEKEEFSGHSSAKAKRLVRVRKLILMGLAVSMALATLAPVVVLAG